MREIQLKIVCGNSELSLQDTIDQHLTRITELQSELEIEEQALFRCFKREKLLQNH